VRTWYITVKVYQTNTNAWFRVAEQSIWYYGDGGAWSNTDGTYKLTLNGDSTSGSLRFISEAPPGSPPEAFVVTLGLDSASNGFDWVDIAADLQPQQTASFVQGEYYQNGQKPGPREPKKAKHSKESSTTNKSGRKLTVKFTSKPEGDVYEAVVIIG
jgi:hypothetical protein